jgi:hemoglobin-like flavoprotein
MTTPAFPQAAEIERSLELLAERRPDPTPAVYERLFAAQPEMKAHFWRDANDAIKGEMLAQVFAAILDFIGERRYADHMIGAEMITHEGYDVPREVFATFFGTVAQAVRDVLGADFTPEMDRAWRDLLADLDAYVGTTPGADAPVHETAR